MAIITRSTNSRLASTSLSSVLTQVDWTVLRTVDRHVYAGSYGDDNWLGGDNSETYPVITIDSTRMYYMLLRKFTVSPARLRRVMYRTCLLVVELAGRPVDIRMNFVNDEAFNDMRRAIRE